jgi:hypothetical protein
MGCGKIVVESAVEYELGYHFLVLLELLLYLVQNLVI